MARLLVLSLCVAVMAASSAFAQNPRDAKEIEIGKKAPNFKLPGVDGKKYALADHLKKNKAVVVTFTCNACPWAKAWEDALIAVQRDYRDKKVQIIAINSNDPKIVPTDSFEHMKKRAKEKKFNFPYVYDETQEIAAAYGAKTTPHIFLVNSEGKVVYRGAIDDSRSPRAIKDPKTKKEPYLRNALEALLAGKEIAKNATKARGCTIKWKKKS